MTSPTAATSEDGNSSLSLTTRDKDMRLTVRGDLAHFEAAIAHYPDATKGAATWLNQYMHARCNSSPAIVLRTAPSPRMASVMRNVRALG